MNKCIRRTVEAIIVSDDKVFFGYNYCNNKVDRCPRDVQGCKTHKGYSLCREICDQPGHAEIVALREAGDAAMGATLYILGHDHACDDCIEACRKAGIKAIKLLAAVDILWVNEESL